MFSPVTNEVLNLSLQNQNGKDVHAELGRCTRPDELLPMETSQATGSSRDVLSKSAFHITNIEDVKTSDTFNWITAHIIREKFTAMDATSQQLSTKTNEGNRVAEIPNSSDAKASCKDSEECGKLFGRKTVFEENGLALVRDDPSIQKTAASVPGSPTSATVKQDPKETKGASKSSPDVSMESASRITIAANTICHTPIQRKQFARSPRFVAYNQTHVRDKQFICEECKEVFSQVCYLIVHKRLHNGDEPYMCDECGRKFKYMQSLNAHKRSHDDKPFACEECAMYFKDENNFARHKSRRQCNKSPAV